MSSTQFQAVQQVCQNLFYHSSEVFWILLPIAFLISLFGSFIQGETTGKMIESLLKRTLIAIILLLLFPTISDAILGLEAQLIQAFGGEQSLSDVFTKLSDRSHDIQLNAESSGWFKLGQYSIEAISTLSFLVLSIVRRILDLSRLLTWNLLHILAPISLLAILFPSMSQIPKGIFMGMLELSLWKPIWIIFAQILLAAGFSENPKSLADWFDIAVVNFAIARIMTTTPSIAKSFLNGALGSTGGATLDAALAGTGAAFIANPMNMMRQGVNTAKRFGGSAVNGVKSRLRSAPTMIREAEKIQPPNQGH